MGVPKGVRMRNRKLRNAPLVGQFDRKLATDIDVIFPRFFSLYRMSGCSLRRLRPIFSMVTGTNPGYLPLLFSHSVYVV